MPKDIPGRAPCSIEGCDRPSRARGWCNKHWQRWSKNGDPLIVRSRSRLGVPNKTHIPLADRFWTKVDKNGTIPSHAPELGPCWPWTGSTDKKGYGRIAAEGRKSNDGPLIATHVALGLVGVIIPPGFEACHRCDNPPCVNPDHLYAGTRQQNHDDMVERGRQAKGFNLPHTKLSDEQVREIRSLHSAGSMQKDLAEQFGVHAVTINDIVHGRRRTAA